MPSRWSSWPTRSPIVHAPLEPVGLVGLEHFRLGVALLPQELRPSRRRLRVGLWAAGLGQHASRDDEHRECQQPACAGCHRRHRRRFYTGRYQETPGPVGPMAVAARLGSRAQYHRQQAWPPSRPRRVPLCPTSLPRRRAFPLIWSRARPRASRGWRRSRLAVIVCVQIFQAIAPAGVAAGRDGAGEPAGHASPPILMGLGIFALHRYKVVRPPAIVAFGVAFEIAVAFCISMIETTIPPTPASPVLGISSLGAVDSGRRRVHSEPAGTDVR